jgi:uncharacterized protein YigA (DUF484 family)
MTKDTTLSQDDLIHYFEQNPGTLIKINDALDKQTASFIEHRIKSLKNKNLKLEGSKKELMIIAQENTSLFQNIIKLAILMSRQHSVNGCIVATQGLLMENNKITNIRFYLKDKYASLITPNKALSSIDFNHQKHRLIKELSLKNTPFCGDLNNEKINDLFPEINEEIHSIAGIPIKDKKTMGIILLGSGIKHFFNPSQSTDYLSAIGQILSANLERLSNGLKQVAD